MKRTLLFSLLLALCMPVFLSAQTGVVTGYITDAFTNQPIGFANVIIPGTGFGTISEDDGSYRIEGVPPGLYDVRASFVGYTEKTAYEIAVTNSKPAVVDFKLEEFSSELEEVVVTASPFKKTAESPVSLRTIGVAEIQRNPGGNRDISKVVQSLPGVTTVSSFRNDLIIRGGAPNENRFYLDDVEVPNINHFATQGASGGPVGLINVSFIREVDFYSGAFPANRGNALSSVFQFQQRDGRDDRMGGTFMVGASDVGFSLEGPIGDRVTYLVSARRSYLQFLFQALELPFLPTYNDAQFKIKFKINPKHELYLMGLGAIDQFELNLDANDTPAQQFLLNNLPVSPQWNYTNGLVYKYYQDNGYWTFVLSRNMLNNESKKYAGNDESSEDNLLLDYKSQEIENKLRIERTVRQGANKWLYGGGYEFVKYNNRTFNRIFTPAGPQTIDYQSDLDFHKYYAFAQFSRNFFQDRLVLSLGVRADGNSYSDDMNNPLDQLSPRFSLSYALTERLSANFNVGRYFQLPPYTVMGYQEGGVYVNRENNLKFIRTDHLVFGLEYNTNTSTRFTVEGYYKKYNNYPFLIRDSLTLANLGGDFGVIGNEPVVSRSKGQTYGVEFLVQQRLYKGFYGIAAYTLGWSAFEDKEMKYVPSSWDARHILNLTFGKKFKGDWEAGVNWRFQTGLPYTPFSESSSLVSSWDVNNRALPDYDQLNTLRTGFANTLDVRIDKKWYFDKWSMNIYIDVENVLATAVATPALILDRPKDQNGTPIGDGVIINPDAPYNEQRYLLKEVDTSTGTPIPSLGIMIEI
ncbi:MAG: TonB-dependent receptor [Saprospiraceae bacterium]|nr:TonB-dependent receptor [Saprospiraceae bacterium]